MRHTVKKKSKLLIVTFIISIILISKPSFSLVAFDVSINDKVISTAYLGDEFDIEISGLKLKHKYILALDTNSSIYMSSKIKIYSDQFGKISTKKLSSLSGSFLGSDPYGLFWSQTTVNKKLLKEAFHKISVYDNTNLVVEKKIIIKPLKDNISYREFTLEKDGFVGTLITPQIVKSNAVVVTLSGSEGGKYGSTLNAMYLANHGISSMAVAYFQAPGLPKKLDRIPLEYF